jgi:Cys-tRNA(Pro)/Cys-tRNA(Cys) deacylase
MGEAHAGSTPALALLVARGVPHTVYEYEIEEPSGPEAHRGARVAYGAAAAAALGVPPERLYKTLVIALEGGSATPGELALAVLPSSAELSERAAAAALGAKRASLARTDAVQRATGSVPGGVSPIGTRRPMRTLIDASAEDHTEMLVSAGRRGLSVALAPRDLITLCIATFAPLSAR